MKRKLTLAGRKKFFTGLLLLSLILALSACGDAGTSTPIPLSLTSPSGNGSTNTTTAAGNNSGNSSNSGNNGGASNSGFNGNTSPGASGRNGQFNPLPALNGSIESVDTSAKSITVKGTDGQSQKLDVINARVTKSSKLSVDQLGKLITGNTILQFTGEKGSDGSYNATQISVVDETNFNNPGGTPGAGRGQGFPGANGTPDQGRQNFTPPANFTPGANGTPGQERLNRGNAFQMVRNATLNGNKITGTDFSGATITVNLSDTTTILERTQGTLDDLKAGQTVSISFRPTQAAGQQGTTPQPASGTNEVVSQIVIEAA